MKYKVRIGGRSFEAEVGNVDARPIVVMVEGERFEVWPEAEPPQAQGTAAEATRAEPPRVETAGAASTRTEPPGAARAQPGVQRVGPAAGAKVRAPIPGVVDSIAVRAGDAVSPGDALCVIEAMKMKNTIRASRQGTIDDVLVTPGQHVHHNDVLMEFAG